MGPTKLQLTVFEASARPTRWGAATPNYVWLKHPYRICGTAPVHTLISTLPGAKEGSIFST